MGSHVTRKHIATTSMRYTEERLVSLSTEGGSFSSWNLAMMNSLMFSPIIIFTVKMLPTNVPMLVICLATPTATRLFAVTMRKA